MIYLASVYSLRPEGLTDFQYASLVDSRAAYAEKRCAELMVSNYDKSIFSPITHCHHMSKTYGLPKEWDFWQEVDLGFIEKCDELWVLQMPGWEHSVGITAEIAFADALGIPVKFLECEDYIEE